MSSMKVASWCRPHSTEAPTRRANGSFLMSSSVVRWYCRISFSARLPGLYRNLRPVFLVPSANKHTEVGWRQRNNRRTSHRSSWHRLWEQPAPPQMGAAQAREQCSRPCKPPLAGLYM